MMLELDVTADAADAVSALDRVASSADDMGTAVTRAGDTAGPGLASVADGADAVDSRMSQATGAVGALAGGFEALGLDGVATGLTVAATATDTLSGAGGLLNLVTSTQAGAFVLAKTQMVAHTVAMGAMRAATAVATGAQWAMNAALTANPIGLVVVAVAAFVAGLVLAYQKSETFRDIVDGAMRAVSRVVGTVVDAVQDVIDKVRDAEGPWAAVRTAVDLALTPAKLTIDAITTAVGFVIDAVQDLIGWIDRIDFPDVPDLNPFGRSAATSSRGAGLPGLETPAATPVALSFQIQGDTDPDGAAERIIQKLDRYLQRRGLQLVIASAGA